MQKDAVNSWLPWLDVVDIHCNVFAQDLMRELDEKEDMIKSVQDKAERLMLKNHPAKLTIEVSPFFVCVFSALWSEWQLDLDQQSCLHPAYSCTYD